MQEVWMFAVVALLIVMVPGVDSLLVLKNTILHGRKAGILTMVGNYFSTHRLDDSSSTRTRCSHIEIIICFSVHQIRRGALFSIFRHSIMACTRSKCDVTRSSYS